MTTRIDMHYFNKCTVMFPYSFLTNTYGGWHYPLIGPTLPEPIRGYYSEGYLLLWQVKSSTLQRCSTFSDVGTPRWSADSLGTELALQVHRCHHCRTCSCWAVTLEQLVLGDRTEGSHCCRPRQGAGRGSCWGVEPLAHVHDPLLLSSFVLSSVSCSTNYVIMFLTKRFLFSKIYAHSANNLSKRYFKLLNISRLT